MHRKFITMIVAAAIAVSGISSQAHADNGFGKTLAGIVVLGIVGAAIIDSTNNDTVAAAPAPAPEPEAYQPAHQPRRHGHVIVTPRPKPHHVERKTLPASCIGTVEKGHGKQTEYLGGQCLNDTYGSTQNLPRSCKERVYGANGPWSGYNVQCLERKGYHISHS